MPKTNDAVLNAVAEESITDNQKPETQLAVVPSKRVLANRRNAQKSTGPNTLEGKARSKRNATKHGLLGKQILAANKDNPKAQAEYNALEAAIREDCCPVGAREDMLVDIIVRCYWSLAGVQRFELRQMDRAIAVDGSCLPYRGDDDTASDDILRQIRQDPDGITQRLDRSVEAIEESIDVIRSEGYLDLEEIECLRIVPGDLWRRCMALHPKPDTPHMFLGDKTDSGNKISMDGKQTLEELEKELPWIQHWKSVCLAVQRNPKLRALVIQPDIPDARSVELILRLEPMLQRELYRAMDQLERLQRRRQGEAVPPPINARLSVEQ